jgi:hypothetical protein
MAKTENTRPWFRRLSSAHVALALLVLIVVTACGSTLVRNDLAPAAAPGVYLDVELDQVVRASFADGFGAEDERLVSELEAQARPDDALIVRMATLELEVEDVAAILLDARREIAALGGYVSGSDEFDQGERRWASVTYRVPVNRFVEAIDSLRGLSERVVRESTQSQEVTATVVDLDARISNLRASESALAVIMDRSGRIDDVLAVQMRLEDVRGQIERLEAQRSNLADRASLSTLSVTWFTPVAAVAAAQEGWSLATEVDTALAQTVEALQGVATFGVWLAVVGFPVVGIPLLLLVALFLFLRRRIRRGRDDSGVDGSGTVTASPAE